MPSPRDAPRATDDTVVAAVGHHALPLQEPAAAVDAVPVADHVERVEELLDRLEVVAAALGALRNHSSLKA